MHPLLFLDVDGVLNCRTTVDRAPHPLFGGLLIRGIDPEKVVLLDQILDDVPEVGVVLSSSWRELFENEDFEKFLVARGLRNTGRFVGRTDRGAHVLALDRGGEIALFMRKMPLVRFVVLDDLRTQFLDTGHQVMTSDERGLTHEDAVKAVKILKYGPWGDEQ